MTKTYSGMNPMMMSQMANMNPQMLAAMNGMSGGMSMGMGIGGQGQFGGFGQNDSWMNQDAYNANEYGNASLSMQNNGFNQGNYNNQYQTHDFQGGYNRGFYRGRGRGRGSYGYYNRGRGGHQQSYNNSYNQNHANQYGYANQNTPQQPAESWNNEQQEGQRRGSPVYGGARKIAAEDVDDAPEVLDPEAQRKAEEQMMKELNPGGMDDDEESAQPVNTVHEPSQGAVVAELAGENEPKQATDAQVDGDSGVAEEVVQGQVESAATQVEKLHEDTDNEPRPIQSFVSGDDTRYARNSYRPLVQEAAVVNGANDNFHHGGWSNQAQQRSYQPRHHETPDVQAPNDNAQLNSAAVQSVVAQPEPFGVGVAGAPTGPKALREGLPNTGYSSRGFQIQGRAAAVAIARTEDRPRSPSPLEDQRPETRSPSPPERRSSRHRHRRHRSRTRSRSPLSNDSHDDRHDKSRQGERRHRRSHKYEEEAEKPRDDEESYSSHRHHRRRHEKEHESSSRRHRRDRDGDRDHDKDYDRDHDKEARRRHRRRRSKSPASGSALPTPTSAQPQDALRTAESFSSSTESRKRRYERVEDNYDRSKRSKREESPQEDHERPSHRHREREPSKPIPNSITIKPISRRGSTAVATPASAQTPTQRTFVKPPPTGPRGSQSSQQRPVTSPLREDQPKAPPSAPAKDPHTMEREARNAERLQREMQRRAFAEAPQGKRRDFSGRKSSYKYDDENSEEVARKGELLREGGRW